jgi:phage/plasmid-associated DNA primase
MYGPASDPRKLKLEIVGKLNGASDPGVEQDPEHQDFNTTDTGNAERLVARHGKNIRFNYSRGVWHVWTGSHWCEDTAGQMDQIAKDTASCPNARSG